MKWLTGPSSLWWVLLLKPDAELTVDAVGRRCTSQFEVDSDNRTALFARLVLSCSVDFYFWWWYLLMCSDGVWTAAHHRTCRITAPLSPVLIGGICVSLTVNCLQYLVTGSTRTAVGPFQLPAPQSGTLSRISSWTRPSVWTVSDGCLKLICSLDTSAFSALEVLTTTALYKFTYLLTYLLTYLSYEHLKTLGVIRSIPKYLILSHHNISRAATVLIFTQLTLCREPIRIHIDFPTLIAISRQVSSVSQACKSCWSAVTDGASNKISVHLWLLHLYIVWNVYALNGSHSMK